MKKNIFFFFFKVMLLNELKPGLKYEVDECGDSPATKRFVMTVSIENHTFEGSGASKKLAKQACARMALTTLYNFSFTPGLTMETDSEGQEDQKDQKVPGNPHNQRPPQITSSHCTETHNNDHHRPPTATAKKP